MSEQAAPEPTMEEILASIRRIISEDDGAPADVDIPRGEEPELTASSEPLLPEIPEEPLGDDVLELTDRVDAPPAETLGDIAAYAPPEPPAPEPPAAAPPQPEDVLVGEPAAMAAASAFGQLSAAITMPEPGRTLEDVVRELLRPLLKDWLDSNLPRIVEAKVAEEVERISRTRLR
jgi:cell pole-organizing protein PopZ